MSWTIFASSVWAHDVVGDFAFFDEFDSFAKVTVDVADGFDFVNSYAEHRFSRFLWVYGYSKI
jgi:hypothetical protein